jgi:solute carrier family 25 oxoglutarate transporter 11
MVVNAAQLATYSQAKQMILSTKVINDGIFCHFCASMISGLATTIASMPVDIAKTRIQNQKGNEYKGTLDVFRKVIKNEGFFSLWKGFTPYYMRLGPHTVLTFIILEQMNAMYFKLVFGTTSSGAL